MTIAFTDGTEELGVAACDPGDLVTGGGFDTFADILLTSSLPFDDGAGTQAWLIFFENFGSPVGTAVDVYAICLDITP